MQFSIGADPEIFVCDANSVRTIIGKVGGSKDNPRPLPLGDGFAVQEDNVALEFNIPASSGKKAFITNIVKATSFLEGIMKEHHGLHFDKRSAVSFPSDELNDPEAHVFGCDPDYNAWTRKRNPRPHNDDRNLRSCGGHIHVGCTEVDAIEGVKACDLFLGVSSVLMDTGELRKSLYGKAGAFRKKTYGFEYRTLSNYWIFSKRLIGWAYDNTERALDAVSAGMSFDKDKKAILAAIDNNDKHAAQVLVDKYKLDVLYA